MIEPKYTWDEATRTATCILVKGRDGREYIGTATCHPDDEDMMSKMTGFSIATLRAELEELKDMRREIEITVKSYAHLYSIMSKSKKFNSESYEARTLRRKLYHAQEDLACMRESILDKRAEIKWYIDEKEKFYTTIRKNRAVDKFYEVEGMDKK